MFNLGGPDSPEAVEPFLFNLFNDPAIIGAPGLIRWALAKLISRRRAPVRKGDLRRAGRRLAAAAQYGGPSRGLGGCLGGFDEVRVFIAMRYWHPMTEETLVGQVV